MAVIYNLNPLFSQGLSGQGQTIVVIEDTNVFSAADWTTFRSTFGLSGYAFGKLLAESSRIPAGNCTNPGVNGDDGEAILDAEYASAAAPNAAIELASCKDTTTFGGLIALQNLLNAGSPPSIVSISYGFCEAENGAAANAAYNSAYQQAATAGVSVFVSSGDESAASCDANAASATHGIGVSGFASTPFNVSVGGTDFIDTFNNQTSTYWSATNSSAFESAVGYIPEIPWNDSCASALIATFVTGSGTTTGTGGFCNNAGAGGTGLRTTASGSGGPSGCATGADRHLRRHRRHLRRIRRSPYGNQASSAIPMTAFAIFPMSLYFQPTASGAISSFSVTPTPGKAASRAPVRPVAGAPPAALLSPRRSWRRFNRS